MNPIWTQIIIQTTLKNKSSASKNTFSDFRLAKGYREFRIIAKHHIKDFLLITVGIISVSFGFKGFFTDKSFY